MQKVEFAPPVVIHAYKLTLIYPFTFSKLFSTRSLNYVKPDHWVTYVKLWRLKVAEKQQKRSLDVSVGSKMLLDTPG